MSGMRKIRIPGQSELLRRALAHAAKLELRPRDISVHEWVEKALADNEVWKKIVDPLTSGYSNLGPSGLYLADRTFEDLLTSVFQIPVHANVFGGVRAPIDLANPRPIPQGPDFEVNMMEALVGWRVWDVKAKYQREPRRLASLFQSHKWEPETAAEARCVAHDHTPPVENCTCGIYGSDDRSDVVRYLDEANVGVFGEVYGWGRYVRGEHGWRAQFAYPKSFYTSALMSPETYELLKEYHVPIYQFQPVLFYNPEEDGYENREDDSHGSGGANPYPTAYEEDGEDADD